MANARQLLGTSGRSELTTRRCELRCEWCSTCRTGSEADPSLEQVRAQPPPKVPLLRLGGGDPFRFADLVSWVGWARTSPDTTVLVEGPAASFGGVDRQDIVERVLTARPDAVSVVLPTVDEVRTTPLTGLTWSPAFVLDSLAVLANAGLAIEVVVPVHPTTVGSLSDIVLAVARRLGSLVDIVLRRMPSAQGVRLPVIDGGWPELEALSDQLASLPDHLPDGARLQMDASRGYPPCLLRPEARRRDLVAQRGTAGKKPLGDLCGMCALGSRCRASFAETPPPAQVRPLSPAEAEVLEAPPGVLSLGARPHTFHTDRARLGIPDLLCLAPWTTLTACEPRLPIVPCALSWVETTLTPAEMAVEMGTSIEAEQEHARLAQERWQGPWYVTDNPELSLLDLWNGPLIRKMRREMTGGLKSSRCRSMCRVVMGVEERGINTLQRPDSELTPEIVRNRQILLEEVNGKKHILTARPLELIMGVSAHCNISCGFCDGPLGKYGDLTDRRRDEIIELLPTLISFGVAGPGEPLMNGNFLQLLAHISDTGYPSLSTSLTTNGILLTPAFLKRNRNVPWGHVRISLNAGSAATHENMTGKKHFDRLMENLDALCELRDSAPRKFPITLSFVLGEKQMGDLRRFAEIAHRHRTNIVVEPMYGNMRDLSPWVKRDRLEVLAEELKSVASEYQTRNPDIARAVSAVEKFARQRLAGNEWKPFAGH